MNWSNSLLDEQFTNRPNGVRTAVQADWQCKVTKWITRKVKSSMIHFTAYQQENPVTTIYGILSAAWICDGTVRTSLLPRL